jgi:hypothetical protein
VYLLLLPVKGKSCRRGKRGLLHGVNHFFFRQPYDLMKQCESTFWAVRFFFRQPYDLMKQCESTFWAVRFQDRAPGDLYEYADLYGMSFEKRHPENYSEFLFNQQSYKPAGNSSDQ